MLNETPPQMQGRVCPVDGLSSSSGAQSSSVNTKLYPFGHAYTPSPSGSSEFVVEYCGAPEQHKQFHSVQGVFDPQPSSFEFVAHAIASS